MSDHTNEYLEIPAMLRRLRACEPGSSDYRRLQQEIVAQSLPLADHIARRFRGRGETHQDLQQVACVGLMNALNRFDTENGADFVAFAVPTIMGEVRRYFRDCGWAVKVPRRMKDLKMQLAAATAELSQTSGRAPTASELAEHLGVPREDVVEATIAGQSYATVSTDAPRGSDSETLTLQDSMGSPDSRLDKVLDVETVRPLLAKLPERQRTILHLRFFDEMTQTQIAERMGCSQMHISRLLTQALKTVRDAALNTEEPLTRRPAA
jgi:RNA polymerase sigma-B factor